VTTSDNVTFSTRSVQDFPSSSSDQSNEKRGLDEFSFTTMESSTEFNRRAIRPIEFQEEVETSTSFLSGNPIEMTTNFEVKFSFISFVFNLKILIFFSHHHQLIHLLHLLDFFIIMKQKKHRQYLDMKHMVSQLKNQQQNFLSQLKN
jgi:hypothetical protein